METLVAIAFVLAFARLFGFMQMLPLWGDLDIPTGIKLTLCAGITPFLVIGNIPSIEIDVSAPLLAILIMKEVAVGLFMGFLVSLPLRLPEMIGDMIDNQRGAAVTDQFNPTTGGQSSILGQLLTWVTVTYFFVEGGFQTIIGLIGSSFAIQPVTTFTFEFGDNIWDVAYVIINNYMRLFAIMCLPVVIAMGMAEIALGISTRFAQSFNVFYLSQSVKSVVAIGMLLAIHPKIIHAINQFFYQTVDTFS